jgi:RNA polymerase primary sigma factor
MEQKKGLGESSLLYLYLKAISKHQSLSISEENRLAERIQQGDEAALNRLVEANLRFVVNVAKNYQNQGMTFVDLINEGNVGLLRAARRFDGKKNFKFITYAVWWIRQGILKALAEQSRIVKVPLNKVGTLYKVGQAQGRLEQRIGHFPNAAEIAQELGIEQKQIEQALSLASSPLSLDAPLKDEGDGNLYDCLSNEQQESPEERMERISLREEVSQMLAELDERERNILKLYFGIGEEPACTLDEIGERFKLTRERARQLKQRAIMRIRSSRHKHRLHTYY